MAYEFKKLSDVETVEAPVDSAKVLIEENGVIKRAPKTTVGSDWDAIIDLGESEYWNEIDANKFTFVLGNYESLATQLANGIMPKILLRRIFDYATINYEYMIASHVLYYYEDRIAISARYDSPINGSGLIQVTAFIDGTFEYSKESI